MKTLKSLYLIALTALLFSCNKNSNELFENHAGENLSPSTLSTGGLFGILCHAEEPFIMYCSEAVYQLCYNNTSIGTVTVKSASNGNKYVTYKTTGQWYLKELYMFAGDASIIPATASGTLLPDLFPNTKVFSTPVKEYTFIVANMPSNINVAANAEVQRLSTGGSVLDQQSAWGGTCSQ